MSQLYFIYDNLKINPFILGDQPLPGFHILSWTAWTLGTLWDVGGDAGFTLIGKDRVYGQVWKVEDYSGLDMLKDFEGLYSGRTNLIEVDINIPVDDLITERLRAETFSLSSISSSYCIVKDGKWRF